MYMLMHCNVHNMMFLTELNCASIFYVKYCDLYVLRCGRLGEHSLQLNECHKEPKNQNRSVEIIRIPSKSANYIKC